MMLGDRKSLDDDTFTSTRWKEHMTRVAELRSKLTDRASWIEEGRFIPDNQASSIAGGLRL